jgi:hypothetical protein
MTHEQTIMHVRFCIRQMEILDRRPVKSQDVARQMDGWNRMLAEDYARLGL